MRKIVNYLLLLMAVTALSTGVYLWNKPHRNIENVQTERVDAGILASAFEKDERQANRRYLSKALTVRGVVGEVSENDMGQQVVFLTGDNDFSGVQCTIKGPATPVKAGDTVSISGFCNGYTVVVVLDDCKLLD